MAAGAILSSAGYLLAFTVVAAGSLGAAVSLLLAEEATRDFDARFGQIAAESRARGY